MAASSKGAMVARSLGGLVLTIGIAIVITVLWLAYGLFKNPDLGLASVQGGPSAADIGIGFARLLVRIGLLFLGSVCGSMIASRGVSLITGTGSQE